jgi:hypothetical protein
VSSIVFTQTFVDSSVAQFGTDPQEAASCASARVEMHGTWLQKSAIVPHGQSSSDPWQLASAAAASSAPNVEGDVLLEHPHQAAARNDPNVPKNTTTAIRILFGWPRRAWLVKRSRFW